MHSADSAGRIRWMLGYAIRSSGQLFTRNGLRHYCADLPQLTSALINKYLGLPTDRRLEHALHHSDNRRAI
jgi:hypothetical protein